MPLPTRRSLAVLLGLALTGLPGCGALSALGDATTPLDVYELRAPSGLPTATRTRPLQVTVEVPTTGGALQTDRILIRPDRLQAQYLPDVRWSEETPEMVQTLMLRSLENTNAVAYVGRRPLGTGGDVAVMTELTDFQAEAPNPDGPATVVLRMTVRLVRESDVSILGARTFSATAQTPSTELPDVVAGFDAAAAQLFTDFARWSAAELGAPLRAGG